MGIPLGTSLGKHCNTVLKLNNEPLDVDVVVTSFLESNIHSLRHNYFHLNRCGPHACSTPSAPERADPYAGVVVRRCAGGGRAGSTGQNSACTSEALVSRSSLAEWPISSLPRSCCCPCPCFNPMQLAHDRSQGQQSFETEECRNASCGMPLLFIGGSVFAGVGTSASAAPSTGRPPAHHRPEAWHYWPQSLLPFRGKFLAKTVVIALITAMITAVFDLLGAGRW